MLSGEYRHILDAKNRIFIPAKYREELGESFMVTRSFRGRFLCFYSMEAWNEYVSSLKGAPRKDTEDPIRYLYRMAADLTPDSQGRVLLPQALVDFAGITKNAVVVGCGDYGEIWAEDKYDAMVAGENVDAIRDILEKLGL